MSNNSVPQKKSLSSLQKEIVLCRKCPRLVAWREKVAVQKVARFRDETYWGKPVQSFGDLRAKVLIIGLAPAAHGANRTGRMFTGDRSGDFLFSSLCRTGFANQAHSTHRNDGLTLKNAYITAIGHCCPPENKLTIEERNTCLPFLERELSLLNPRVLLILGGFAWNSTLRTLSNLGHFIRPKPKFGHGKEVQIASYQLLGCFHPSQQNTFTGRLTPSMIDAVFCRAKEISKEN